MNRNQINNFTRFSIAFACLLLLVSLPVFIYYALSHRYGEGLVAWFSSMSVFCVPLALFCRYIKVYLYLLIPVIFFSLINLFCIVLYNVPLNYDIFYLALNTNFRESSELLSAYTVYFVIGLLIFGASWFFIFKYIPNKISVKHSLFYTGIGAVYILCLVFFKPADGSYISRFKGNMVDVYPGTAYYGIECISRRINLIAQHNKLVEKFKFAAHEATPVKQRQVYVMIIGESARYDHWGINGYGKPTSPRLGKRTSLISFDNMVTGGYITELSVPMQITRATAANYQQHYREKSIVSAFKEAGFSTYWISSQLDFGDILMHAKEAGRDIFLSSDYKALKGINRDMQLIGKLKQVIQNDTGNIFVVVHTLGSHYDYDVRYPDEYNFFKPSAKENYIKPTDFSHKEYLVNSYDNSILYTDAVIDSAITLLQQSRACTWLSYTSDHGENLFDDSRHLSQHGFPVPTKYIAHVPWFIWTSDSYKNLFAGKVSALTAHKSSALGSENVFNTLTDMGNLTFPKQSLQQSASSTSFLPQPQLILGGDSKVFDYKDISRAKY